MYVYVGTTGTDKRRAGTAARRYVAKAGEPS